MIEMDEKQPAAVGHCRLCERPVYADDYVVLSWPDKDSRTALRVHLHCYWEARATVAETELAAVGAKATSRVVPPGTWAKVELLGHQTLAGQLFEVSFGSSGLFRLDVPEFVVKRRFDTYTVPAWSKYIGVGAIYGITLVDEERARSAARTWGHRQDGFRIPDEPEPPPPQVGMLVRIGTTDRLCPVLEVRKRELDSDIVVVDDTEGRQSPAHVGWSNRSILEAYLPDGTKVWPPATAPEPAPADDGGIPW